MIMGYQDMTVEERAVMQEHIAYWQDKAENGIAIVLTNYDVDEGQLVKLLKFKDKN